jgi:uncharacterized iron-regulated membrane protein
MNRLFYAIHKWISAAAFVQLAIWTVSGFVFATVSQESIRSSPVEGAHRTVVAAASPVSVARVLELHGPASSVELRSTPQGLHYLVRGEHGTVRVDARDGSLAPVTAPEAEAIAREDQPGQPSVRGSSRIESAPPIEYRDCESGDCPLPVFRVELADAAGTVVYVDAATGDVTARRNDRWRTYDFFWSLHIMDYRGREDFNHWLIRGAAILAMCTVASGIILLAIRAGRWLARWRRPEA